MTNDQRPTTVFRRRFHALRAVALYDHSFNVMPLSNSATRRYTPPTCTLEVAAKNSPLSRWVGQSVLKDLRFELRFDDPRQSDDKRVTIRGDAESLEILCNSVNSYVQNLLDPSKAQLPLVQKTPTNSTDTRQESTFDGNPSASVTEPEFQQAVNFSEDTLPRLRNPKPRSQSTEIFLQPKGLLYHELFLGRLANEESGEVVNLTVIQLFDLATALDEYAAELVALPNLNTPKRQKSRTPWGPIAAGAVLALGVTAGGVQLISQSGKNQVATKSSPSATPASTPASESLLSQVPPPPPTPIPITPIPTPSVPLSLASSPTLSPPGRVTIPTPEAVKDEPIIKKPQTLAINPSPLTIPVLPQRTNPIFIPTQTQSLPSSSGNINRGTSPSSSSSSSSPSLSSSSSSSSSPKTTAGQSTPSNSTSTTAKLQPLPALPANLPTLKASPSVSPTKLPDQVITETTPSVGSPATDLRPPESAIAAKPVNTAENTPKNNGIAANSRLADSIPQVAEVRSYFQQRWKPPSGLTQTIEYSLSLNADGSIQRILPLGQAAGKYIDGTGIPLPGEPFVSPVEGSRNPTIRVVFTPDGKVDTFLEK